jgi:hypothetical protein
MNTQKIDVKLFKKELKQKLEELKGVGAGALSAKAGAKALSAKAEAEAGAEAGVGVGVGALSAEALNAEIDKIIHYIDYTHPQSVTTKSIQVCAMDVKGILYFVDAFQNVYKTEDILNEVDNPKRIGKVIL